MKLSKEERQIIARSRMDALAKEVKEIQGSLKEKGLKAEDLRKLSAKIEEVESVLEEEEYPQQH